jgi:phage terminase large subunit-like protein
MGMKMNAARTDGLEYIIYEREDEISALVRAYNLMVHDLSESSKQAAQVERDKAWSEMARQVAHEIKNPLTPIKLQIQRIIRLKAKNDPSYMPTVLTKDLNLPANQASAYLSFDEAINEETYAYDPKLFKYCVVGIDAADTIDLNAATALFMKPGDSRIYRKSMYWIAEEQVKINSNNQRGRDGVPYQEWAARGLIRIVPGNKVSKSVFVEWIQELADMGLYTRFVGYDPWHMDDNTLENLSSLVGSNNVEVVRQGVQTLSQPMKQLKADLRDNRIIDDNNPIDHWCNLNLAAKVDVNENVQPVKKAGSTTRIDGFMAMLDAYIELLRHEDEYKQIIGWHD